MKNKILVEYKEKFNECLTHFIQTTDSESSQLLSAMKYSLLNGGKRIRTILVYTVGDLFNTHKQTLNDIALAIEMMHAFSLIHDDLPAMDNDELRRGKKTCHVEFDEATAILAGDALQSLAFETLSKTPTCNISNPMKLLDAICLLAKSTGYEGMAAGQMLDMLSEGRKITLKEMDNIHLLKTGALISTSIMIPFILSPNYSNKIESKLLKFSRLLGLAFQIQDDILDITSTTSKLGKVVNRDIALEKSTYPNIIGLNSSKEKLETIQNQILNILDEIPIDTSLLQDISNYVSSRSK